ncbi:MAG: vanomycin resistance protein VanB [Lachnospiraceae bacterium]|nr:vanomycin resistance protein VanB [Lachnospiraceae bacterium]
MKWKQCAKGLLIFAAFCMFGMAVPAYAAEEPDEGVIADGIIIGGLDVGGKTESEAKAIVEEYFERYKTGVLYLSFNGTETQKGFDELGITWDNPDVVAEAVTCGKSGNILERYKELTQLSKEKKEYPIEYSLNESLLEAYLQEEAEARQTEAVDATIKREGKTFEVSQSTTGLTVDVPATVEKIVGAVQTEWAGGRLQLEAVVQVTEPKYKTEELKLIQDVLGDYSTDYNPGSADRSQNLTNGTGFINGQVLLPGETLSLYDYLYPCTVENGYRAAIAYADGGYVDSIGGGICQISTTLYNALLKSELEVVTRAPHSMTVSYVEPGFDSAQSAGSKDLCFKNSTDYPVYVEAWASGGKLYTALWGKDDRPANREVIYYNNILSRVGPGAPIVTEDPNLPAGQQVWDQDAYDAIKVELYKQVKIDGQVVETTLLHTDRYKASPAKIRVGVGEPLPEENGGEQGDPNMPPEGQEGQEGQPG